MTPELALQKAIGARLAGTVAVTSLVPATAILDRNQRPAPSPSIVIGEGQSVDEGDSLSRSLTRVYMDLHVWKKEPGTQGVKAIAGAIRKALHSARLTLGSGFHAVDASVSAMRFVRDPDGETSHAIVTINAKVQEIA